MQAQGVTNFVISIEIQIIIYKGGHDTIVQPLILSTIFIVSESLIVSCNQRIVTHNLALTHSVRESSIAPGKWM
jgi:hypothetical protein